MGVATGYGCKEVYRLPHTTYTYSSCICSFLQQHPHLLLIKKRKFFVLVPVLFEINFYVLNNFFAHIHMRSTTGVPRQPYEGCT